MSSAYKLYFILGNLFIIYLMGSRYMANKIGDKIELFGTPCLSLYGLDIVVFILMKRVLPWIYLSNHLKIVSLIPI